MLVDFGSPSSPNNNVLLILDGSYVAYFCSYSAVNRWKSQFYNTALETIQLPEPGSVPYDELPDLVNDTFHFKRVLLEVATEKLSVISNIVLNHTGHFYGDAGGMNRVDTVIALDSHSSESFRRKLYPEYKITRNEQRGERNDFNHWKIFQYIYTSIFPEIFPKGCTHAIKIDGAEGDDVIATIARSPELKEHYRQMILVSSDHDFCQLQRKENNIRQFDLKGDEIVCDMKLERSGQKIRVPITADQALLIKIITGDKSDNIPGIKKRLGPVGAWKLVQENARENLMRLFKEDKEAALAFQLNRKLIAFDEIPQELQDRIIDSFKKVFQL